MLEFDFVKKPHIFLIGCGGTGSYTAEHLVRLLNGSDAILELYDGDNVEVDNLTRQNFKSSEMSLNKAVALTKRFNTDMVLDKLTIKAHDSYITDKDEFSIKLLTSIEETQTPIIVMCVDNVSTRRLINEVIDDIDSDAMKLIAIDSGNTDQTGQVVVYSNSDIKYTKVFEQSKNVKLASMLKLYPELDIIKDITDENPGIKSICVDNANKKPQSMMANVLNADIIATVLYKLFSTKQLPANVWSHNLESIEIKNYEKFLE